MLVLHGLAYAQWISKTRSSIDNLDLQLYTEDATFMIYRADAKAVPATGIEGYGEAKKRANALRASNHLKWDQVKFRAER